MADLDVWMGGALVGHINRSGRSSATLDYSPTWSGTPLSVSLPTSRRHHPAETVTNYLWGLLPDNELVIRRWARDAQVTATDIVGLLAAVGEDVAGAAQYVPAGSTAEASRPGSVERLSEGDVAELVRSVAADNGAWHRSVGRKAPGRWSLAGAQGKLALAYDPKRGWGVPRGSAPTTHIIKPAIQGLADHDLNEHLCLAAANRLGLRAATTEVRDFDDVRALVVTRYDRATSPVARRVHQEDLCQALGMPPAMKYQSEGGPSVAALGQMLRAVSADPTADVRRFVEALIFNWAIVGTDAHSKNYSLLLAGTTARLAPLYDVASVLPYGDHPKKAKLAMKIGGTYRPSQIGSRQWQRTAAELGVEPDWLHIRGVEICRGLPDALADAAAACGHAPAAAHIVDSMAAWAGTCVRALAEPSN